MRHVDEKQLLMVQVMEALEGEIQNNTLGLLPSQLYQQMPTPLVKRPPPIRIPPPSPKETTYCETDSEVYQPRTTLSGGSINHQFSKRKRTQHLNNMLDENSATGSSGVIVGKRENGQPLLNKIKLGKDEVPAKFFTQLLGKATSELDYLIATLVMTMMASVGRTLASHIPIVVTG